MSVVQSVITLVSAAAATSSNGAYFKVSDFVEDPVFTAVFAISGGTLTLSGSMDKINDYTIESTTGNGFLTFTDNFKYLKGVKTSASDAGSIKVRMPR